MLKQRFQIIRLLLAMYEVVVQKGLEPLFCGYTARNSCGAVFLLHFSLSVLESLAMGLHSKWVSCSI